MIQIREKTLEEVNAKLEKMRTDLNKIAYLEKALKTKITYEIKNAVYEKLAELYEDRKMYGKAGKAMSLKAGVDFSFREKIESYLRASELYSKSGDISNSENMFVRAMRDATFEQKQKIKLTRKNIYLTSAKNLEKKGKKVSAIKFYEILIKMNLEEIERREIKEKLIKTYKSLGKNREIKLLEGL